jgi:hypothetical protein
MLTLGMLQDFRDEAELALYSPPAPVHLMLSPREYKDWKSGKGAWSLLGTVEEWSKAQDETREIYEAYWRRVDPKNRFRRYDKHGNDPADYSSFAR